MFEAHTGAIGCLAGIVRAYSFLFRENFSAEKSSGLLGGFGTNLSLWTRMVKTAIPFLDKVKDL